MGANTGLRPEQALERERAAVAAEAESMSARLAAALAEVQQRELAIADLQKKARGLSIQSPCTLVVQSRVQSACKWRGR